MERIRDIACVILAGGRGERMASSKKHKVCFKIAGRPAIVRAIDTYKAAGLRRFVVVVGNLAEQVISTVAQVHPDVSFVYQEAPRGTGHAAAVAADALAAQGYSGPVMVAMGDKVTVPHVIRSLVEQFLQNHPDLLVTTLPPHRNSSAGRVVLDKSGNALGIVEPAALNQIVRTGKRLELAGQSFSAAQIKRHDVRFNASMYVYASTDLLRMSLRHLRRDSDHGEMFLTDTVEMIARSGKVENASVADPTELMAFNTPAGLLAVEEVVSARETPPRVRAAGRKRPSRRLLKQASQWLDIIDSNSPRWQAAMRRLYGKDQPLIDDRRREMKRLVRAFIKHHGPERKMILCRAPARINLMGRHVDHRGGFVNVMAISREVLLAAGPREDDLTSLRNLDTKNFPLRRFRILDMLREASWSDWLDFVNSRTVLEVLESGRGDWSHYARAPLLRLQHECRDASLKGMDCLVSGNIPMGAGLSSSSALVVAFAQAAVALNGLNVSTHDFVDLCGEGEWFVGSRGGSADHAAISTGRLGYVSRIGFFPFRMAGEFRFPPQLRLVIAHSGSMAVKSAGARDVFNQRVACYSLAELYLRRHWPPAAGIEHLRDLTPQQLEVGVGEVYRALKRLPVRPTRGQLRKLFSREDQDTLDGIFSTHAGCSGYDLRGVAMFGISEILRSERMAEVMGRGDLETVGEFFRNSHDGDRVARFDENGDSHRHTTRLTDSVLERLACEEADLAGRSGRYACSTEAIDHLVDIANATDGVVGAQLAGAGLGGCMMILVHDRSLETLKRRLRARFYKPRGLTFNAHVVTPVEGAGPVVF